MLPDPPDDDVPSCAPAPLGPSDCNAASFPLVPAGVLGTWLLPQKVEQMSPAQLESTPLLPTGGSGEGCEVGPGRVPSCCGAASAMVLYQSCVYRSFSSASSRVSGNHAAVSSPVRPLVPGQSRSEGGAGLWCAWGCATTLPLCHSSSMRSSSALRAPLEGARANQRPSRDHQSINGHERRGERMAKTKSLHYGLLLIRRRRPRIAVHLVRISRTQRRTPRLLQKERSPVARTAGVRELTKTRNFSVEAEPKEMVKEKEKEKKIDKKGEEKRS